MRPPRIDVNSFERGESFARSTLPWPRVVEQDLPVGDVRGARQDPHDRLRGDRLARARFADQRHRAAGPDAHRQAIDGLRPPGERAELDRQVADAQEIAGHFGSDRAVSCLYGAMELLTMQ